MTDFYITLPSADKTPGNSTSKFRVHLPETIGLTGEWEVGLTEIQYPKTWKNLTAGSYGEQLLKDNQIEVVAVDGSYHLLEVRAANYETVNELVAAITETLASFPSKKAKKNRGVPWHKSLFELDLIVNRVKCRIDTKQIKSIMLSKLLMYMLGFKYQYLKQEQTADYAPDMRAGIDSLYIYCDIVENQIIGNTRSNLLRIVPVEGRHGDLIDRIFVAPHYVPVLRKQFSSIEITINTDTDRPVQFDYGKVVVLLHFRKRHNARDVRPR